MALIASIDNHLLVTVQRSIYSINLETQSISVESVPAVDKKTQKPDQANGDDDSEITNGQGDLDHINNLEVYESDRLVAVTTIDKVLFLYRFDGGQFTLVRQVALVRCTSKIRFSPDGKQVLVADKTGDCYVCNWDEETPKVKWILGHCSLTLDILMTRDSKFVITSDRDEKIRVTNYPNTEDIESYCLGHSEYVSAIEQLPAASQLLSVSGDKTLRVWNYLTGVQLTQMDLDEAALNLASSRTNGSRFAISQLGDRQSIAVYQATNGELPTIEKVAEYSFDADVKHINKIVYESDDCLWVVHHTKSNDIALHSLRVDGSSIRVNDGPTTVAMNLLKDKVPALNAPLSLDVSMLFKKKYDESQVIEYYERKKRRLEEKKGK